MEYRFVVRWDTPPDSGERRWRWALVSPAGSDVMRSDSTFDTPGECEQDAEDRQQQLCRAKIVRAA